MTKKEIVFFTSNLSSGGAEGVCVKIANALSRKGWDVKILVQNLSNDRLSCLLDDGIKVETLSCLSIRFGLLELRRWILVNRPSNIVTFHHMLTLALILIRYTVRVNYKIISRNINNISSIYKYRGFSIKNRLQLMLLNSFYHRSDVVIHQCQRMKEDFIKNFPYTKSKSVVIFNPTIVHNDIKENEGVIFKSDEPYFLYIGRLEPQKSLTYAIKAFAVAQESWPSLRFRILGEGSMEFELRGLTSRLGVEENVDFLGFVSNTAQHFIGAEFTILSSLYEGFPNVLLESISYGTPIVSFDCFSGPSEIIEEGVNGYLVEHLNVMKLAEKIVLMKNNDFKSEIVMSSAYRFSIDKIASEWEQLIFLLETEVDYEN
ncbi:glycosyltransferase [Vibrio breoganii]